MGTSQKDMGMSQGHRDTPAHLSLRGHGAHGDTGGHHRVMMHVVRAHRGYGDIQGTQRHPMGSQGCPMTMVTIPCHHPLQPRDTSIACGCGDTDRVLSPAKGLGDSAWPRWH